MKKITSFVVGVFLLFNFVFANANDITKINILYTQNTNGVLENCHCPVLPLGGLEKRQTILKEFRKSHSNVLFFDSGDFFSFRKDSAKNVKVIKAMQLMKYDAVNIGVQEFSTGETFLINQLQNNNINVISTNLKFKKADFSVSKVIYKTIGNIKIAILGIVDPNDITYYEKGNKFQLKRYNPTDIIKKWHEIANQDKFDIVILLSNMGFEKDKEIADKFNFIDIIIGGHTQNEFHNPKYINNTIITQSGKDGKYIGSLQIEIKDKKIDSYSGKLIPVKLGTKDDEEILSIIKD
ncbi:MAG: hypothetical protein U9R42_12705 [Bacteroidota bacterium]|nr:hypothetical protein [Bacteroidota bacterium]